MAERWLVIDDSSTIQRVIKLAFQDYDVIITEADSCAEAGREMQRVAPNLVIADAAVTGAQSVQDFVNLRNQVPQTPFIILEGSYDNIDESHFRGAGFFHFLKKPFDAVQLLAVTRNALGRALPQRNVGSITVPPPPPGRPHKAEEIPVAGAAQAAGFDLGLNDGRSNPRGFAAESMTQSGPNESWPVDTGTRIESKGVRRPIAFSLDEEPEPEIHATTARWDPPAGQSNVHSMLEPMLKEEMEGIVRAAVEEYCRKNFPTIAREMIGRELERLTQERSRLLLEK